ncbi:hypothetical protein [Saccharophagus degradans]|uniref:Uncharacterized protein n=1 Tax=Saccharophagus degradans TaxID=86304 RepID=A0AAW7X0A5_9GAMM|nr:hypothetical protein [Saccharophagus degradans]MDO6421155.1 hypothetical protein [Saccharophagus degradans]MDO6605934.1 hypothetical protein [Saccharophagus degradans]
MKIKLEADETWLKSRESLWAVYEKTYSYGPESGDIDLIDARKKWFLEGDLNPLVQLAVERGDENGELSMSLVLNLCPAQSVEQHREFLKKFCLFLSRKKIGWWADGVEDKNKEAIQTFSNIFSGAQNSDQAKIYEYYFEKLIPVDGEVTFPFSLGDDNWVPSLRINVQSYVRKMLYSMWRYLYGRNSHRAFSHVRLALSFVRQNVASIDAKVFDVDYLEEDYYSESGEYVNCVGQECMREILARLNGYNIWPSDGDECKCYDLEFEAELKKVFENASMPPAYYQLLDFIHEHKEDCV